MVKVLLVLLLGCLVGDPGVAAEQNDLEEVYGPKMIRAQAFFEALQRNLVAGNRQAVCAVVSYPLEQSFGKVVSPVGCRERFAEIFSADLVQAVTSARFEDLIRASGGLLGVRPGKLWFTSLCLNKECSGTAIRVMSVSNDREMTESGRPSKGRVLLACHTKAERLEVVADGARGAELRLWQIGRPRTAPPDTHVSQGTAHVEGTGVCGHVVWEFSTGERTYVVSEGGCYPDSAPKDTAGAFQSRSGGSSQTFEYCIQ